MENKKEGFNVDDMLKNKDKKTIPQGGEPVLGRPKKKALDRKSERVVCYLTKSELADMEELAEEQDITISNLVRKTIIQHIKDSREV